MRVGEPGYKAIPPESYRVSEDPSEQLNGAVPSTQENAGSQMVTVQATHLVLSQETVCWEESCGHHVTIMQRLGELLCVGQAGSCEHQAKIK